MQELGNCYGHLESLQRFALIYGYIEIVVWGVLTGSLILYMFISACCKNGRRDFSNACAFTCNYLLLVLAICGVIQVVFDITLIHGLQHQHSALVLSYFIFGVISDVLRVPLCIGVLVTNGQSGPDKSDKVTRGFCICGLIYTVLHIGVLWMVFRSYQQVKAFPHCLV